RAGLRDPARAAGPAPRPLPRLARLQVDPALREAGAERRRAEGLPRPLPRPCRRRAAEEDAPRPRPRAGLSVPAPRPGPPPAVHIPVTGRARGPRRGLAARASDCWPIA